MAANPAEVASKKVADSAQSRKTWSDTKTVKIAQNSLIFKWYCRVVRVWYLRPYSRCNTIARQENLWWNSEIDQQKEGLEADQKHYKHKKQSRVGEVLSILTHKQGDNYYSLRHHKLLDDVNLLIQPIAVRFHEQSSHTRNETTLCWKRKDKILLFSCIHVEWNNSYYSFPLSKRGRCSQPAVPLILWRQIEHFVGLYLHVSRSSLRNRLLGILARGEDVLNQLQATTNERLACKH